MAEDVLFVVIVAVGIHGTAAEAKKKSRQWYYKVHHVISTSSVRHVMLYRSIIQHKWELPKQKLLFRCTNMHKTSQMNGES